MSISDSIPEMPANTSGTYSIMIRANLESDDILITSNNQLAFGQKLQVCCYVNMDSIRLTKKIKLWEGNNVSIRKNTELDPVYQENTEYRKQQYRIQNTGVLGGVQQRLLSELHQGRLLLPQADRVHKEVILNLNKT